MKKPATHVRRTAQSLSRKDQGNTSLQEKLKAAADVDAALAIAKEAGFSITADDLKNAQSVVSEEELENVAGGSRLKCQAKWFTFYECSKVGE